MSEAPLPDDHALTEQGLDAPARAAPGRVLMIACGALAHEILALKRLNGWEHMELTCLPAKYHLFPDKIPDAVREKVAEARAQGFAEILVVYADCGTGGLLDTVCDELGVTRIAGPHCYSFFEGNDAFAAHEDEITAFYLTDFLVKQFDAFVWRPMGLDRHPELRDMIFGNYTKLVYLSQVDDAALEAKARASAERLGLAYEHRHTGYGDLTGFLASAT
ncbi:MAG: DUF1638 domain-containing protein [Pseudomonadota bacterium]